MSDLITVVIEIPKGSRNKYEFDHDTNAIWLDRRLFSATTYPADYGFVPDTLAEDGDPLDALVLVEDATFPGCHIESRVLGVLWMQDEQGPDAKIIAVPSHERGWADVESIDSIPETLTAEIQHFFDVYKDLEPGKESTTRAYEGRDAALAEIQASRDRWKATDDHAKS